MPEFEFNGKKQNIQLIKEICLEKTAREIAIKNKEKAFDILTRTSSLFSQKDHITLTKTEKRYRPFWSIHAENYLEYKRQNNYRFNVEPEVRSVKINNKTFEINPNMPLCEIQGEDHCIEKHKKHIEQSATEEEIKDLKDYLKYETSSITSLNSLNKKDSKVFSPTIRASYIVRNILKEIIKPFHADIIIQEKIEIKELTLYLIPSYAFEFLNKKNEKRRVLEINAVTSKITKGPLIDQSISGFVSENLLFEIGAEIASMIIPGAGVGALIGKEIHSRKKKNEAIKKMRQSQKAASKKST